MLENISGFLQNKDINLTLNAKTKQNTNNNLDKLNSIKADGVKVDAVKKIIVVSKGEAGYIPGFDTNQDGLVTMDEFNKYCSENGISEEEKLKLLSIIQAGRTSEQLQKESKKAKQNSESENNEQEINTKQKSKQEDESSIYARRGDKKYNEKMDENNDSVVTYEEYRKYCEKVADKSENQNENESDSTSTTPTEKQANQAYKTETPEEPEFFIETEA